MVVVEMHSIKYLSDAPTQTEYTTTGRSSTKQEMLYTETRQSEDAGRQLIEVGEPIILSLRVGRPRGVPLRGALFL